MKRRTFLALLGFAPISAAASSEAADKTDTSAFRQITKTTHYLTAGEKPPIGYPGHLLLPGEIYHDWRKNELWARDESGWSKIEWVR